MTTTVTVKTHTWPVAVSSQTSHNSNTPTHHSSGWTDTTEFMAAHSERSFVVHATCSLRISELPEDATSLDVPREDSVLATRT